MNANSATENRNHHLTHHYISIKMVHTIGEPAIKFGPQGKPS